MIDNSCRAARIVIKDVLFCSFIAGSHYCSSIRSRRSSDVHLGTAVSGVSQGLAVEVPSHTEMYNVFKPLYAGNRQQKKIGRV
jgi:hypothetical protein